MRDATTDDPRGRRALVTGAEHTIDGGTRSDRRLTPTTQGDTVMTDLTAVPAPIRDYLTAHDSRDDEAAIRAFAPHATVTDEGQTHTGTQAIRAWRRRASTEYTYTTEITGIHQAAHDTWVVAVRLEGNFPGGIADLQQRFTVRDEAITELTIA